MEREWNYTDREEPKYARETFPSANMSTISLTWIDVGSNTVPRSVRPISNRLSHCTAVRTEFKPNHI
jgi:hypothetical protein